MSSLYLPSRRAIYNETTGKDFQMREGFEEAQKNEFLISKALYKNQIKASLNDSQKGLVNLGSVFSEQKDLGAVFKMQEKQFFLIERLEDEANNSAAARAEVKRLAYMFCDSILKNPQAKKMAFDGEELEKDCRRTLEGKFFIDGEAFKIARRKKELCSKVLRQARKEAEQEVQGEKVKGLFMVVAAVSAVACIKFPGAGK